MATTSPWARVGGVLGASAVALGAYGAHGFSRRADVEEWRKQSFDAAARYQLVHAVALAAAPAACSKPNVVGGLLAVGTVVFSGGCFAAALTGDRAMSKPAPYGGMMLIAGWLALAAL